MGYKQDFIDFMVRSGVLTFGEFTLKSGRVSPYFINTGNYRTGAQAARLGEYYAACYMDNMAGGADALYGPAYKGIPLVVAAASSLYQRHGVDIPFFFNRKEAKDHGEGGVIIGYQPKDGDRVVIMEDVITAGTAIRESMSILKAAADVTVKAVIIQADRMERGTGEKSAVQQVKDDFGIDVYPIVNIRDIVEHLHNRELDGKVPVDDGVKAKIENYLETYGV
jgi:orotate phosphoribosyltransferase